MAARPGDRCWLSGGDADPANQTHGRSFERSSSRARSFSGLRMSAATIWTSLAWLENELNDVSIIIIIIIINIIINQRHWRDIIVPGTSRLRDKIKSNDVHKFDATYVYSVFSGRVRACEKLSLLPPLIYWQRWRWRDERWQTVPDSRAAIGNARTPLVVCFDRGMTSDIQLTEYSLQYSTISVSWK